MHLEPEPLRRSHGNKTQPLLWDMRKGIILTLGALLAGLVIVLALDNPDYQEQKVIFEFENNRLAATLIVPKNHPPPYPVVVFVHGDGALPYDAYGYYSYLWHRLAKKGVASFSWDKAGVGGSSGNWLSQSMTDRADEVIAGINHLRTLGDVDAKHLGLLGFSQAGWVMPLVSARSAYPDFTVSVSGAINWLGQGDYLTRNRLRKEGFSQTKIEQAIDENHERRWVFEPESRFEDYLNTRDTSVEDAPLTRDRYYFAKLNWRSDARKSLKTVRSPFLGVFGDHDINVDWAESLRVYGEIFTASAHPDFTLKTFPDAQHSLLKARYFRSAYPGLGFLVKLTWLGEGAFADGFLDFVTEWIVERSSG